MLLPRTINIELDAATWPRSAIPATLSISSPIETIDVASVLNLIGILTTPPLSGGASLSELWAFVRYLFAITSDPDLRLTSEFLSMDPHQKTILSDDFGMGFTMHWLAQKLGLVGVCDGRYFIENHLHRTGGTYSGGTAKRGPGKSPDFVALDARGRFHVIECKGTQSSLNYRNRQLIDSGLTQKRTVLFPPSLAGERLCAGIFIAGPDGDETSMKIIDPEPEKPYKVKEDQKIESADAIAQGLLAKQLRTVGFPRAAAAVAFPWQRESIDEFQVRSETSEEQSDRLESGLKEISYIKDRKFFVKGEEFIGRRALVKLPRPFVVADGNSYDIIEIRQGIVRERFSNIQKIIKRKMDIFDIERESIFGKYTTGKERGRSWIMIGESYYGDMRFRHS